MSRDFRPLVFVIRLLKLQNKKQKILRLSAVLHRAQFKTALDQTESAINRCIVFKLTIMSEVTNVYKIVKKFKTQYCPGHLSAGVCLRAVLDTGYYRHFCKSQKFATTSLFETREATLH